MIDENLKQLLSTINSLDNIFDHCEYISKTIQERPLSIEEYSRVVGILSVAKIRFPELSQEDSWFALLELGKPKGLGDTIESVAKALHLDKVATIYTQVTGNPCGCTERKDLLNKLVPYNA